MRPAGSRIARAAIGDTGYPSHGDPWREKITLSIPLIFPRAGALRVFSNGESETGIVECARARAFA